MKSNWKTEEEARKQICPMQQQVSTGMCQAAECGHWVWGPKMVNTFEAPQTHAEEVDASTWSRRAGHHGPFALFERINPLGGCGLRRLP